MRITVLSPCSAILIHAKERYVGCNPHEPTERLVPGHRQQKITLNRFAVHCNKLVDSTVLLQYFALSCSTLHRSEQIYWIIYFAFGWVHSTHLTSASSFSDPIVSIDVVPVNKVNRFRLWLMLDVLSASRAVNMSNWFPRIIFSFFSVILAASFASSVSWKPHLILFLCSIGFS